MKILEREENVKLLGETGQLLHGRPFVLRIGSKQQGEEADLVSP